MATNEPFIMVNKYNDNFLNRSSEKKLLQNILHYNDDGARIMKPDVDASIFHSSVMRHTSSDLLLQSEKNFNKYYAKKPCNVLNMPNSKP